MKKKLISRLCAVVMSFGLIAAPIGESIDATPIVLKANAVANNTTVSLSGYIWQDVLQGKNIQYYNDIYDSKDISVSSIEVQLLNNRTNEIQFTYTNDDGFYKFENVSVSSLSNYSIKIEYDGLDYTLVTPNTTFDATNFNSSSKAYENTSKRTMLNSYGENITSGKSEAIDYSISATISGDFLLNYYNSISGNGTKNIFDISYLNIGLRSRAQPDLFLDNEMHCVELIDDGDKYVFYYNQKLSNLVDKSLPYSVDFDNDRSDPITKREVIKLTNDNSSEVNVIYRSKIQNAGWGGLFCKINSINCFYPNIFEIKDIYVSELPTSFSERDRIGYHYININSNSNNNNYCRQIIFNDPIQLGLSNTDNTKYVYIKYRINKPLEEIVDTNMGIQVANEISSYSVYSDENYSVPYLGYDINSTPNNYINGIDEHDNGEADGFKLLFRTELHDDNEADNHTYTAFITKEPSCTEAGIRKYKCKCGKSYTEEIPKLGHNFSTKVVKPTYTERGYTLHTCTRCDYSYKDNYTDVLPRPDVKKLFEWGKDNWSFINSDSKDYENHGFTGGTNRDHISSTYLNKLIDQASNKETNRIYHMLDEDWNGSCFGMTSVIVLAKNGLLPYDNYTVGATNTYGLDKPLNNSSVDSLITYYLLSQNLDYAQQRFRYYYTTEYGKPELQIKRIIAEIDKYGMANICDSNHSLLAYDYGYGSWRWYGVSYNGCIYLCDPNCSDHFAEEYCLYFNTNSYNWIIPHYGTRKSSIQGDYIDFVVGDPDILNTCGYLNNNPKSSTDFYYGNLTANLVAENHNVSKMIKSESGYTKTATNEDDIISCVRPNMISGDGEDVLNYILKDTKSAYILSQNNPEPLDLSIDYENCLLEAASPAGKSIIFDYNGYVKVDGESADYAISMTYNDSYPTDWFTIEVNGENANTASLEMVDNGWILSSDNLEGIVVNANNKEVKAATSFSTEYPSAFIYEIDENTIGIAVDTDNNGTYETTLNTESKTTISNAEITTESAEYLFDDKAVEPIVTVKIGDEILKLGEDYTVEYVDNDKIGTAKIVVTGIGKYSGTTSMIFEIIAKVDSMLGDVNNDGKINVTDVSKTAAHVKGIRPLDENAQKRADVNGDNKINVTDIAKIAAHVKGIKPLS